MKPISPSALNELLVECSTLNSVSFDLPSKVAVLTFCLDGDEGKPELWITINCEGVFQIVLAAHSSDDFSQLGIEGTPTLARIDEIARAFRDQYIFEWELDCDEVIEPILGTLQVFLENASSPDSSRRGIRIFKDTERSHFELCIVGTDVLYFNPEKTA